MILYSRLSFFLFLSSLVLLSSCGSNEEDPSPDAPEACFTTTSGELQTSMSIQFTSDCSVNAVSYAWDFGDSQSSTEPNPVHSYTAPGKYSVKLTVKSAGGAEHSVTQALDITETLGERIMRFGEINADETWQAGVIHVVFSSGARCSSV